MSVGLWPRQVFPLWVWREPSLGLPVQDAVAAEKQEGALYVYFLTLCVCVCGQAERLTVLRLGLASTRMS